MPRQPKELGDRWVPPFAVGLEATDLVVPLVTVTGQALVQMVYAVIAGRPCRGR